MKRDEETWSEWSVSPIALYIFQKVAREFHMIECQAYMAEFLNTQRIDRWLVSLSTNKLAKVQRRRESARGFAHECNQISQLIESLILTLFHCVRTTRSIRHVSISPGETGKGEEQSQEGGERQGTDI